MRNALVGSAMVLGLVFGSARADAQVVVKDSHLKFEGFSYFRGAASSVGIGSFGKKMTPLKRTNYLSVDGTISADDLGEVDHAVVVTIDTEKTTKNELFGELDGNAIAAALGVSVDVAWERIKSEKLKLVKLTFDNGHLKKVLNRKRAVLDQLRDRGKSARIVNTIFVVMSAEMADTASKSASIQLSAQKDALKLTMKAESNSTRSTSVTISEGATFAYGLVKIDWEKGKDSIDNLNADEWGG